MLSAHRVAYTFQPEFPGLLSVILSYGKTWVIIIIGSFVVMIPDFAYEMFKLIYFPTPTDIVMRYVKTSGKVATDKLFTVSEELNYTEAPI
jgi:hypothetical protein